MSARAWFVRSNGETVHSDPASPLYVPGSPPESFFDYRETCLREGFARIGMPASGDLRQPGWRKKLSDAYGYPRGSSDEKALDDFLKISVGDVLAIPANAGPGRVHLGVVQQASPPNRASESAYYYHYDIAKGDWYENAHRVNVLWARDAAGEALVFDIDGIPWRRKFSRLTAARDACIAALNSTNLAVTDFGRDKVVPLEPIDEAEEFPEGRELYRTHKTRERDSRVVQLKKTRVLGEQGRLACEVCGFDFQSVYGVHGAGFIECHHSIPVSEYVDGQSTKLGDLRLVCANCHRVLHRVRPWMTVEVLRARLTNGST